MQMVNNLSPFQAQALLPTPEALLQPKVTQASPSPQGPRQPECDWWEVTGPFTNCLCGHWPLLPRATRIDKTEVWRWHKDRYEQVK